MKTVGKQLQDARNAKGWSPEMAARETKIRVDRLHDLEVDDYSNFSSPTYARGFVRTYARALGLDEYKILRQLDNKLPEDDNATFVNDSGVPYIPEPSQVNKPFELGRGVYLAGGVAGVVLMLIGFILVQSYRAGYFASTPAATPAIPATNALPIAPETETARALPADGSAPPVPVPVDNPPAAPAVAATPATSPTDTNAAPRALPVNPADLAGGSTTPSVPAATSATPAAPVAPVAPTVTTSSVPVAAPVTTAPAATTDVPAAATPVAAAVPAQGATAVPASIPAPATTPAATAVATAPPIAPAPDLAPANVPAAAPADATVPITTTTPPRALPVDLGAVSTPAADQPATSTPDTTSAPTAAPAPSARQSNSGPTVDVAAANNATDTLIANTTPAQPAQAEAAPAPAPALTGTPDNAAPPVAPVAAPVADPSSPAAAPSSLGAAAAPEAAPAPAPDSTAALTGTPAPADSAAPVAAPATTDAGSAGPFHGQRLVLTASHDSFVRVIALDGPNAGQALYSSTLHSGQSISFNDRKYSINVGDPSAVDIALDGINYGPHSDNSEPDTFTVESHIP